MVEWQSASNRALELAQAGNKPILIFFPAKEGISTLDGFVYGDDYKKLAEDKAIFVRVAHNADRTPAPFAGESPIPQLRLASDNPSREYKITQYPTFIIADKYGNEVRRLTSVKPPTVKDLETYFAEVPGKVETINKEMAKNLESVQKAWEKKNAKEVIKAARRNFERGVVGLEAQQETIRIYNEALDSLRDEIKGLDAKKDAGKLKNLEREYRGTEIAVEIREKLGK